MANNVGPIPCHSYNDCWRPRPINDALDIGCVGIEADVWLYSSDLLVGHTKWSLRRGNTFKRLYVDSLVRLLSQRKLDRENSTHLSHNSIYKTNTDQTVVLLVDLKTNGLDAWPEVVRQLEPLRQRDWLSKFVDSQFHYGPITVVRTSNTAFEMVVENSTYKDIILDAPLTKMDDEAFNPTSSSYASASFKKAIGTVWFGGLSKARTTELKKQAKKAYSHVLETRYSNLPEWLIITRNTVWNLLLREGVDILNVDSLKGAELEWELMKWLILTANASAML
ncbi:PLC-like phosphodiesterase [Colletotrichum truncatum]|uniref:PLC-like phosphodiesterase n=1 Tax=Colletotrichum truncatum TaxID=5467 RepID=A0ACC3ZG78_COLTU|nr:PLC-like phosphodiesterase [Colletotrichum truncatum]KAF6802026.1 PLC-like phosphodiesterase [Colletotrichum truncatum]